MAKRRWPKYRLSDGQVLALLKSGRYRVDVADGAVYGRRGRVKPFLTEGRLFVRLYSGDHARVIALAKLVWMAGSGRKVPRGWEVHHRDEDRGNDSWDNLICLFKLDHRKLHRGDDFIPF